MAFTCFSGSVAAREGSNARVATNFYTPKSPKFPTCGIVVSPRPQGYCERMNRWVFLPFQQPSLGALIRRSPAVVSLPEVTPFPLARRSNKLRSHSSARLSIYAVLLTTRRYTVLLGILPRPYFAVTI